MDALESITNATVGLALSVATVWAVWPLFGWNVTAQSSLAVTGLFWALSAARSYVVRKVFRWLDQ